jgi:regulator of protease activity HflC (stomatin/prohibitin superfamily)
MLGAGLLTYQVKVTTDLYALVTFVALLLAAFAGYGWFGFKTQIVYDFQKALLYHKGALKSVLGAGAHRYASKYQSIQIVDTRKAIIALSGQDILTRDNVNIKLTVVGFYEVTDVVRAMTGHASFVVNLHNLAQVELRRIVNGLTIDELLESKKDLDAAIQGNLAAHGEALGLTLSEFAIRDILLPANLKRAFAGLLEAQKEAQRQLEKARGEQAVLRNLANASKLYEGNPMLLQARLIQTLSSGNNSIVFKNGEGLSLPQVK